MKSVQNVFVIPTICNMQCTKVRIHTNFHDMPSCSEVPEEPFPCIFRVCAVREECLLFCLQFVSMQSAVVRNRIGMSGRARGYELNFLRHRLKFGYSRLPRDVGKHSPVET